MWLNLTKYCCVPPNHIQCESQYLQKCRIRKVDILRYHFVNFCLSGTALLNVSFMLLLQLKYQNNIWQLSKELRMRLDHQFFDIHKYWASLSSLCVPSCWREWALVLVRTAHKPLCYWNNSNIATFFWLNAAV